MTPRKSKRELERVLENLEGDESGDPDPIEFSDQQREHLDEGVSDALEELTGGERNRLAELEEQIESDGGSGVDEELTAAEKEYFDLLLSPEKPNLERSDLR